MHPTCHICSSETNFFLNKDSYNLNKCDVCNLVFVYPRPGIDYLRKKIYSEESGFQSNRVEDLTKYHPNKRYLKMLSMLKEVSPVAKILDVGAGGGHFLYLAHKNGFTGFGVELNKRTADSARGQGLKIFDGTLHEALTQIGSEKFDCVVLGEIIEHVNNPRELIMDSAKILNENGKILITTPNLNCFWSKTTFFLFKFFKIPWSSVTPPYHLFQFNNSNLDLLLKQNNFSLLRESYAGMPSLKYELGMTHMIKKYKENKKITSLAHAFFGFALYTIIYVINFFLSPFMKKNFNMIKIYESNGPY